MHLSQRFSRWLARSARPCLLWLALATSAAAQDPLAWREASSLTNMAEVLDAWLDQNSDLPRRETAPRVRMITPHSAAAFAERGLSSHESTLRGLYDAQSETIWLVMPWDGRDPFDASVLLHELVHHRQADAGHWYCPGAQELPAYRLQEAWLAELGLKAKVNWIAVVLEAGCTVKDFHPD